MKGILYKSVEEAYDMMVRANGQVGDITVEEIFSGFNAIESSELSFSRSDYERIEWLFIPFYRGKIDFSPLRYCINLELLIIEGDGISDFSFISGLQKLRTLVLNFSGSGDARTLLKLKLLENLHITYGKISFIDSLTSLPNLKYFDLHDPDEKELLDFATRSPAVKIKYHDSPTNRNLTVTNVNEWAFSVFLYGDIEEIKLLIQPLCIEAFKLHQKETDIDYWELLRVRAKEIAYRLGNWAKGYPDVTFFETDNATFLRCVFPGMEF